MKGLVEKGESELEAARREFAEETGHPFPEPADAHGAGVLDVLGEFRQPSGKRVTVFVAEVDELPPLDGGSFFELEWPPRSGRVQSFPEIDRLEWFDVEAAAEKLVAGQLPVLDALRARLAERA